MSECQKVLDFWFAEAARPFWFAKSAVFDEQIRAHFLELWQRAAAGELMDWRADAAGRLAEIIVLDQFSRNLWRDDARAFAQDGMALVLAQECVRQADFAQLNVDERKFAIMPMMHSESVAVHRVAVPLFERYTDALTLDFERRHQVIVERFGRYPHRNALLGRASSPEELAFLQQEGSSF